MKIRVLGSSGSEAPGHNSPAFLLDDFLLLDAGTVAISLDREAQCRITHILLTHAHLDHIKGIPSLVDNIVASKQDCRLLVLSGKDVLADLRRNIFNNRIWPDFTSIPSREQPVMRYQPISGRQPLRVGGYSIKAIRVDHVVPAYGYVLEDTEGNILVYSGDSGPTERIWKTMRHQHVRALITEVSFPDELQPLALASGHMTPTLFAKELEKMQILPERIFITHVKPYHRPAIEAQIRALSGVSVEFLQDNMEIAVSSNDGNTPTIRACPA